MRAYNQSTWKKPVTWWYLYYLVFVWRFVGLWNPRLWGMVGWKMLKSLTRISMIDALKAIDQGGQVGHTCLDQRDATKYGPCGQGNKLRWKGDTDTGWTEPLNVMATIQKDWKVGPSEFRGPTWEHTRNASPFAPQIFADQGNPKTSGLLLLLNGKLNILNVLSSWWTLLTEFATVPQAEWITWDSQILW